MDREKKFREIGKAYNAFYASLMRKGRLPVWKTGKGLWGTTTCEAAFELFKGLHLERCKNFLDLGSGDGKAVLIASLFTRAAGIEFDHILIQKSIEMMQTLKLKAEFIEGDYLQYDLSQYDFIFINPDNEFSKGLDEKLASELKGRLLCASMVYTPNKLIKGKTYWVGQLPFTVFTK